MKKLYLIGNAHIDPVWLWRWQDGYSEVLATYRSALDRMKEFEDYKFTSACAVYYEWVEKTDPDMFEEIRARVREGRWNIVGGWYLQPDCNMPTGESFARHALISQRYFKEKFGVVARSGYNVDSFGHNASLPKILRGGGMSRYVFMRPEQREHALDSDNFIWRGDDGSEVTASRIFYYAMTEKDIEKIEKIGDSVERDGQNRMAFYGVGNHGGGPSARLLSAIGEHMKENYRFATVDEFFDEGRNEGLPVLTGELLHHARGCYSAMSAIKSMNRRGEENLLAAERLCLLAERIAGYRYPKNKLRKAWKNILFNQFHDIMCGCSIESAYRDASYLFGEVMSVTEQEINGAMQAIARKVETARGEDPGKARKDHFLVWEHETLGTPVIVFNPHAFDVRVPIRRRTECCRVTDETGAEVPFQRIRGEATNGDWDLYEICFMADIPAYGYRLYRTFTSGESEASDGGVCRGSAREKWLENDKLRVEFDAESGEIARILKKSDGTVVAEGGFGALLTDESSCDTWAHDRFDLGEVSDRFGTPEFSLLESGEVCSILQVKVGCDDCVLTRDYALYSGSDELKVSLEADFRGKNKALKLCFPAKESVICDIPYGSVERKLCGGEEPFAKWFASAGLGVANIDKYGYDSDADSVRMTVLRGAIFADHFGIRDGRYNYMEQGIHRTEYSLFPFSSRSDANRRAALFNSPARAISASFHHGELQERYSAIGELPEGVTVSAIKKSEDGDGFVLRAYESEGRETSCKLILLGKQLDLSLTPYAIATVSSDSEKLNFVEWREDER